MEDETWRPMVAFALAVLVGGGAIAFDPWGWQPFGPAKWTAITVTAWLAAAAALRGRSPLHRSSLAVWGGVLAWAALTSMLATDQVSAWLGTPDRRLGWMALCTMVAAFVAGQGVRRDEQARLVGRSVSLALLLMGAYGATEALGAAPVELTTTTSRLGSTFGSPAYLGAALCLMIPIAAGTAVGEQDRRLWRWVAGTAAASGVLLLVGSATRAAIVGLTVALLVGVVAMGSARHRSWWGAALVMVGIVVIISPLGGALVEDLGGRAAEWRIGAATLSADPVTGTGLEGYRIAFPSHVDVDYVQEYGRSTITDRAHSGPLDLGIALGVAGVVIWAAAAVWLTGRSLQAVRSANPVLAGMAAGVIALWSQELFLFPTLEVGVGGWAVAGIVVAGTPRGSTTVWARWTAAVAVVVALAATVAGTSDIIADHLAADALRSVDPERAERASSLRPDSFRYPLVAADLELAAGRPEEALAHLDEAQSLAPGDPALRLARSRILGRLEATGGITPQEAAAELEAIVSRDPNHPQLRLALGDVLIDADRSGDAERAWLAAEHLAPDQVDATLRLASLYLAAGRLEAAVDAVDRAETVAPDDPRIGELREVIENP